MSSQAERAKSAVVFREFRALLLVLAVVAAQFAAAERAEAAGTAKQLIVFTDKKVYKDFYIQHGRLSGDVPAVTDDSETDNLVIYSYAIVLDDDGNIMKGLSGITGVLDDTKRLDHYHKGINTYHHNTTLNPNFYNNINLLYNDTGTSGDGIAGDGIYTAYADIADSTTATANDILDDHLVINISATYSSLTSYTEVLYSAQACHNGETESHGTHTGVDSSTGNNDPCTMCHRGYEHFYESKSGTFPDTRKDVHALKMTPGTPATSNKAVSIDWNLSKTTGTAWATKTWSERMPGSEYCYSCHFATSGGGILDYGTGDRSTSPVWSDRPSCSQASVSTLGGGTVNCHASTEIEGVPVINWSQPAAAAGSHTNLNDTWRSKSHNHTNPPNKANVSCSLCHGSIHQTRLPNSSATGSDYLNINNQCILCHNITGGLNITANGGKNVLHDKPDCKACHIDSALKLDTHLVPTAGIPNANCTECHDLGGKAPYHIDFNTFNQTDFVHYNVSRHPLNHNASNGSAVRASENKICWGCHGDDPNDDGKANFSEQPNSTHPSRYKNARTCEECHQNESAPWDAPQNVAHSNNTQEVRTPGAPHCYDCHGQPVMFNNSQFDPDYNNSWKATLANHYGTGYPALAATRGYNGYCIQFCHQNTSSPFEAEFANSENMMRPNHSSMTNRLANQSCKDANCHAAYKIHDEKMKKPTLAKGSFGNANCTVSGCHSINDPPYIYYDFHNNVVNCTSCHMDNNGSNIHPIKYLQNNGRDFAQMNITAASCKLCHKNSVGDAVLARWGVSPKKVGSQHHSDDPENGSKWNKTIDPYWEYTPNIVTFVSGFLKNIERGFMTNFESMNDTNASVARISENTTVDAPFGVYPDNHEFNLTAQYGGWYAYGTATKLEWTTSYGNPPGALAVTSTTKSQSVDANWTASFIYNKTGDVAQATIKLDSKLAKAANINTGLLKVMNVSIDDNMGNVTEVYNRSLPNTADVDWLRVEKEIPNANKVFWKNATLDHTYNVTIRTRWTGLGGATTPNITAAYDNVFVNISEVDYKKYNFTFYINNTPASDRYVLVISYQTHVEPARLYVFNDSSFQYRTDLESGAFTKAIIPLSQQEYGTGNITLRINDSSGPNDVDVKPDYIEIEYMFIDSYRWINNSKLYYPCEYCHAPNKHFQNALGVPYNFMGYNYVGQQINTTTNWCASCHYQGYSSADKTYNDVIVAFLTHNLLVPPEITGHPQYGVSKSQSPDYYEHSGLSSFNDSKCFECHGGKLSPGVNSTVFMHYASEGTSGGRNCITCHNASAFNTNYRKIDVNAVKRGMHGNLKNASANVSNASDPIELACWACHGDGVYNESDQHHPTTWKCDKCHTNANSGKLNYTAAPLVYEHIPPGSITPEADIRTTFNRTAWACADCHNNSINTTALINDNENNPINATAGHYGLNRTAGKLMYSYALPPKGNSEDCTYCHKGTSANMTKWGIVPSSTRNLSNKVLPTDHRTKTNDDCAGCHGFTATPGFTFHAVEINAGAGGGPNCTNCHETGKSGSTFWINTSIMKQGVHKYLNRNATNSTALDPINKACWACHGNGEESTGHHTSLYACSDCHNRTDNLTFTTNTTIKADLNKKKVAEHIQLTYENISSTRNYSAVNCTFCHNQSLLSFIDTASSNVNSNVSHYADKSVLVYPTANCNLCHKNIVNASKYKANVTRHPARTQDITYCKYCHNTTNASSLHSQSLDFRFGSTASIHGGSTGTNYWGFDWEEDDWNESVGMAARNDEGCNACHFDSANFSTYANTCENCHLPDGSSFFTGPRNRNTGLMRYNASVNDTIPRVYSHTNYSQVNVPNQSQGGVSVASGCYGFRNVTCHGVDYNNRSIAGGFFAYNYLYGDKAWKSDPYHFTSTIDRMPYTRDCLFCHNQTIDSVRAAWGNATNPGKTKPSIHTSTNMESNVKCYDCHTTDKSAPKDFHASTLIPGVKGNPNCVSCHNVSGDFSKVDIQAINTSIHGGLNKQASASPANATNKPCWGCHGTVNGTNGLANESDQPSGDHNLTVYKNPRKCQDCHITDSLQFTAKNVTDHIPSGYTAGTDVNTSSYNYTYCSYCHNNSVNGNIEPDSMGLTAGGSLMNASVSHYGANRTAGKLMSAASNSTDCVYCHRNSSNTLVKWGILPGSPANISNKNSTGGGLNHDSYTSSEQCSSCHGGYIVTAGFTFHNAALGNGSGGAGGKDCKSCHDVSGSQQKVNFSAMNETGAIHKNLNSGAAATVDAGNRKCWACHGDGIEPSAHPANYKNPYNCTDCHTTSGSQNGKYPGWNVTEHVKAGTVSGTELFTTQAGNCYTCHNRSEMMIGTALDPDGASTNVYGGINGGNNSTSHYGIKRGDIRTGFNTSCTYCHQNSSSVFPLSSTNRSIYEHTDSGTKNITGRTCTDAGCHAAGFIHNSTLTKPAVANWTSGRYDYCAPCHREGGISGKTIRGHNTSNISITSMDCGYCHNASSQGQTSTGTLRIHSNRLANRSTANSTCAACHRDTKYVPAGRMINTHYPGATSDKGNTSESARTCEICHGEVTANKLHQSIVKKPAYDCKSCHLNGEKTSPYNASTGRATISAFQHDNATHAPTNQTNCERCHNNTNRQETFHFTQWANGTSVAPGWAGWNNGTRANCIDCHRNNTNLPPFYAEPGRIGHDSYLLNDCYTCHSGTTYTSNPKAMHWVDQSPANANCTLCHDIGGEAKTRIDVAAMNKSDSIHIDLNKNAAVVKAVQPYASESKRCWACHGNGSEPASHPINYKNAFKCVNCHVPSGGRNTNYTPNNTILDVIEHYRGGNDIKVQAASYCTDCHNKTEMLKINNDTVLSVTNPANDSVSHNGRKRNDARSNANTTCTYCHQNGSTAFESAMLNSLNKSVIEHTTNTSANISNASLTCTAGSCHSTGFIHNATLTKPAVQEWTTGSKDNCAPCHKQGSTNASTYVYAHNTSNISTVSMDCGYCHNSSSQGAKSNNPLKIHTGILTNASTTNTSCAACHRDSTYVGSSRVINTHYPDAPAGKANTSRSALNCEKCHGWSTGTNMHASGLVRKPLYDCNACHNASGGSPYKANATAFVNVTRHDNASHNTSNIINCNWCHNNTNRAEPFHFTQWSNGTTEAPGWAGWVNGTRANCTVCHVTYASQAPFYAEPASWHKGTYGSTLNDCYQCHSNLTVLNASDSRTPVEMHNVTRSIDWSNCNACHSDRYGGAPRVDNTSMSATNSMHSGIDGATSSNINPACKACHGGNISVHRNSTASKCTYCHITNKLKYTTRNVSEHIPNGSYANITVNTSRYRQVFCDLCHNNSIAAFGDDTPGSSNATAAHYGQNRNANRLMTSVANSTDCIFCHKNTSNMDKWGVLQTGNANISNRIDHASYSTSTVCYDCHTDSRGRPLTFHTEELNAGAGSSPNCIGCHNVTGAYRKIDFSVTNSTKDIHRNLSSASNAQGYDVANKPCWGCHGNGSAEGHNTTGDAYGKGTYTNPYNCTDCHVSGGVRNPWASSNGALTVSEHFTRGTDIKASYNATAVFSCLACHQNISEMLLPNSDPDAGTFDADKDGINGTGISAYHYGRKRTDLRSDRNTSCIYCHQNSSSAFPLGYTNRSIYEHTDTGARNTTGANCTSSKCHTAGFIHNQSLRKNTTLVWTQGNKDYCAPCHRAGDTNATKYIYSHNTSTTQASDDCGYCHNASSQGINGSAIKLHSPVLTNTTYPAMYGNCSGCHNGTALYIGTVKQILSHMPNASQFRGNTSMSGFNCASCHNLSGKPSMHSAGMNRSNGNCDTCHFNRTSPFAATRKVIAKNDYNHSYKGQKGCSMAQCHNASNGSVFHMDKFAAGVVAEPEKFNSLWNGRNSIGFTDTPYVDCIDCHREPYNNTHPFNNTYPFNFSTNYSFNYEANHTGENRKNHLTSDTPDQCYNCHTNRSTAAERFMVHNVTIEPLLGGPACVRCHNLSAPATGDFPPITRKVNHTALNQSVHRKLINYTAWNESKKPNAILLDSACWTCHATNILDLPNNAHPDRGGPSSQRPFQCIECHPSGSNISNHNPQVYQNATKIYKHYAGNSFLGSIVFNSSKNCFECHKNSLLPMTNVSYGSYLFGSEANASHYATKGGLARTNKSNYGCNECHAIGGSGGNNGTDYGNAIGVPVTHNAMGSSGVACQNSCHNADTSVNITLHAQKLGIYIGASACYAADCHPPPPPPGSCNPAVEECRGTG